MKKTLSRTVPAIVILPFGLAAVAPAAPQKAETVGGVRIAGDSLFLIDREHGVTVYQYRILEK